MDDTAELIDITNPVEHRLTTRDNPYSPFTQYDEWLAYDERGGYHTGNYLARIARTTNDMSELEIVLALEYAVLEIVQEDLYGIYIRVSQDDPIVPF